MNNNYVIGKIKCIYKTYALVETKVGLGICHISNFSDYKINNLEDFIELYKPTKFLIINKKNSQKHNLDLSFKACNPIFCYPKTEMEHTASGFTKLKQYVYHLAHCEFKKSLKKEYNEAEK